MSDQELTAFHFQQGLYAIFREALSDDLMSIEVKAQDLHHRVAMKARSRREAVLCCEVMRAVFNRPAGDVLIEDAEAECGPELTIRYVIPRPEWGRWR